VIFVAFVCFVITNSIVGRIADTPGVHGIAVVSDIGRLFTTNGRENTVSVVDAKTLQTLSKVETGANPDAIVHEPTQKEIYALNHTGHSATAFEAATGKVTATIPLAGTAETGQADSAATAPTWPTWPWSSRSAGVVSRPDLWDVEVVFH
jgi:YVTN family beta-propeller protein